MYSPMHNQDTNPLPCQKKFKLPCWPLPCGSSLLVAPRRLKKRFPFFSRYELRWLRGDITFSPAFCRVCEKHAGTLQLLLCLWGIALYVVFGTREHTCRGRDLTFSKTKKTKRPRERAFLDPHELEGGGDCESGTRAREKRERESEKVQEFKLLCTQLGPGTLSNFDP